MRSSPGNATVELGLHGVRGAGEGDSIFHRDGSGAIVPGGGAVITIQYPNRWGNWRRLRGVTPGKQDTPQLGPLLASERLLERNASFSDQHHFVNKTFLDIF